MKKKLAILFLIFTFIVGCEQNETYIINYPQDNQQIKFAISEIKNELLKNKIDNEREIELKINSNLSEQAFTISGVQNRVIIEGGDYTGLMYGGLELAERIKLFKDYPDLKNPIEQKPYIKERGLKFNIPLDIRTPSYQDAGDAAQNNILEMWNFDFWKAYLDMMAKNRYNVLTLWNPHPFPTMIKLENYPDAALEDVCGTSFPLDTDREDEPVAKFIAGSGVSKQVQDNLIVLKEMSMNEKIQFWQKVMKYAKDRGIEVYFITWNIWMNSLAPPGWYREQEMKVGDKGKYGINNDQENPKTITYIRECVKEFILTYPDLAGIGITAGENMEDRDDEYDREKWLWRAYGEGVIDAKKVQPEREVKFIHRFWQSGVDKMVDEFIGKYPDKIDLSFKYARARMYALPNPTWANEYIDELRQHGLKSWWNIRNDDIFHFRWGNPEYASSFFKNLPPEDVTAGYFMGSDGYVWGREFISKHPQNPRELEIDKHWYNFMLWGRMGYDPDLSLSQIKGLLSIKYPGVNSEKLFKSWATASEIPSQVTRFHWNDWDFQWAVEGCLDLRKGFHTIEDFIDNPTMTGSNILTIPEYIKIIKNKKSLNSLTPLTSSAKLDSLSDEVLKFVKEEQQNLGNISDSYDELIYDLKAWSYMGKYYSDKIRGALWSEMYKQGLGEEYKDKSIIALEEALTMWQEYASAASRNYKPQFMAKTRTIDWIALTEFVKKDIEIVKNIKRK